MARFFGPTGFGRDSFEDSVPGPFGAHRASPGSGRGVDITELMTQQAQRLLQEAVDFALQRGQRDLDALHVLWAASREPSTRAMLESVAVEPDAFAETVQEQLPAARSNANDTHPPELTEAARKVLLDSYRVARSLGSTYIAPEHVLLAMSASPDSQAGRVLNAHGAGAEEFRSLDQPQPSTFSSRSQDGQRQQSATPTLDEYGQDLTERARQGELDPVVGRAGEIEETIEILSRRTKNNPVLIGDPGVGKTAIVEGIAQRIADEQVPSVLTGTRVVQLDLSGMLAGTRYRGDFEERMGKVIDEIVEHSDEIIVFLDELHTVVGAGGAEGSVDAGNMLKPRLARGELHLIGATTVDEYRKNIEKDAALERRFQPVQVVEPSVEDTVSVLSRLRERYQEHHGVRYTDEAIEAAARLSDRHVPDRFLPDKAIDLVDQAGARKRLRLLAPTSEEADLARRIERLRADKDQAVADEDYERASRLRDELGVAEAEHAANATGHDRAGQDGDRPEVTASDIAEVVARSTGIPVSQLTEQDRTRLQNLEQELHQRVIGQDDAVRALSRAVRRSRSGMASPNRPVGSFLFLGPTGVGKTELAKALAASLFGDEGRMLRLDMSEFQERHTVSRLYGAPPGYVGYGEAGELTEPVRRRPYSVVLLDEIEKAHPEVFNTLLQVLEDGRLTDGQGRTVDFTNTVLIMTSNLGSEIVSSRSTRLGFSAAESEEESLRDRVMPRLREEFRPEFLNRVDEVVVFRRLGGEQLHEITNLLLEDTRQRLRAREVAVEFTDAAVDWIAERGHQPEFGARPLRRTIEQEVDDRVADLVLDEQLTEGSRLRVDVADGDLAFEVTAPVGAA